MANKWPWECPRCLEPLERRSHFCCTGCDVPARRRTRPRELGEQARRASPGHDLASTPYPPAHDRPMDQLCFKCGLLHKPGGDCPVLCPDPDPGPDPINHPPHYTTHPSGVECIQITEHMSFCIGNAVKYLWRAGEKGDAVEDLRKAEWYVEREIGRVRGGEG